VDWAATQDHFREIIKRDKVVVQKGLVISFKMTTLGEYAKVQGGFAYKSKDFIGESEYRVLKIKNVRFGTIDYSEPAFVPKNIAESTINWKLKEGDILISMTGSGPNAPQSLVGRVARVWKNEPDAWFNQRVGRINLVDNKKIHPDFLFYWLSLPQNQDFLVANSSGSANQANISGKTIESLPTPIVDYEISSAIAKIARELDEKIILNTQTNQTLEQIAQAIFKSWFVNFDPVKAKIETLAAGGSVDDAELAAMSVISAKTLDELNGLKASNPEAFNKLAQTAALFPAAMKDSELGEIPEGWKVSSLSELIKITGGGTPKRSEETYWNGDIPWFSVKDVPSDGNVFVVDTDEKITELGLNKSSTKLLPKGTTIITARGTVGKLALVGTDMCMNQSCYGILGKNVGDFYNYFNLKEAVSTLQRNTHGAVFDTITTQTFDTYSLAFSGVELANKFDALVAPLLQNIEANVRQNIELAMLRDTLLPKLLSGELVGE